MGLRALLNEQLEPLDLWLSSRHSGRRLSGPRHRGAAGASLLTAGGLLVAPAPGAVEELLDGVAAPTLFVTYPRQDALCPACRVRARSSGPKLQRGVF